MATWWFEEAILSGNSNPSDAELERLQPSAFSVILHLLDLPERTLISVDRGMSAGRGVA